MILSVYEKIIKEQGDDVSKNLINRYLHLKTLLKK